MQTVEQQVNMYGESVEEMRQAAGSTDLTDPLELTMYAMGIQSDVQELLARNGSPETARKWLNKSKYFIAEARTIIRERERSNAPAQRTSPTTSVILQVRVLIDSKDDEEFKARLKKVSGTIMETKVEEHTTVKFVSWGGE